MGRIVFCGTDAFGHTNPTLGVVEELVKRGHDVWYFSYKGFKKDIEARGAKFIACDEYTKEIKERAMGSTKIGTDMAFLTKLVIDITITLETAFLKKIEELNPDCIVADVMAMWGKVIASKLKIPFVSSTTTFAFNEYSSADVEKSFDKTKNTYQYGDELDKEIKRWNDLYSPIKYSLQNDNDTHTIVYTSPEFQPRIETFSDKFCFVGPSVKKSKNKIEKTKDKLIYISLGTTAVNMLIHFYKNCILAFEKTNYQVIMSVGRDVDISKLSNVPDNIEIKNYVDQIAVLKSADVFLSHCGMNGVHEGLYYSVPFVTFPQTPEQEGNAVRVEQVGAGIRLQDIEPETIKSTLEQVLNNKDYFENADNISKSFKKCLGAKGAANKIENICK